MTQAIWKFSAPVADGLICRMPKGAKILCVQMQNGEPYIWAQVDPGNPPEQRPFKWFGTGHLNVTGEYVGTIQMHGGGLVFHLFEQKEIK